MAENKKITEEFLYKSWLASILTLSSEKKIQLVQEYTPKELFCMPELKLRQVCEYFAIKPEILIPSDRASAEIMAEELSEKKIGLTTILDEDYPRKLKYINDPPFALYYKGCLPTKGVSAAVVGARQCSEYGRSMAKELGKTLGENGINVISGMAYGIDSAGHAGALRGGARTFAVLGCGVDVCYPAAARALYENILDQKGGILSEYPPGTPPIARNFPYRNRIISGLSDIVIVVEAKLKSGSLITADFAMEQGKEVYAVPGRICDAWSQGTNRLIYQGAGVICNIRQFMEDKNLLAAGKENYMKEKNFVLEKEERLLYSCLDFEPKFLDIIIEETGFTVLMVLEILNRLSRKGLVKECYKNYFSKVAL